MRDFIRELEEVKISLRGYDREEMMLYIKDLLKSCEEQKKKDMQMLISQSDTLRQELNEARNREEALKVQYEALLEKFGSFSEAMHENTKYNAERDAQLDDFLRKQDEIENLVRKTRENADKEKEKYLADTKKHCDKLIADAQEQADKIEQNARKTEKKVSEAAEELQKNMLIKIDTYVQEAKERARKENEKVKADTERMNRILDDMAKRLTPILFSDRKKEEWKDEKTDIEEVKKEIPGKLGQKESRLDVRACAKRWEEESARQAANTGEKSPT